MGRSKKFSFLINGCARKTKQVTGKSLSVTTQRMTIQQKLYLYPGCGLGIKNWKIICAGQLPLHMPCRQFDLERLWGFFCQLIPPNRPCWEKIYKSRLTIGYLTHNRHWKQKKIGHMPNKRCAGYAFGKADR